MKVKSQSLDVPAYTEKEVHEKHVEGPHNAPEVHVFGVPTLVQVYASVYLCMFMFMCVYVVGGGNCTCEFL